MKKYFYTILLFMLALFPSSVVFANSVIKIDNPINLGGTETASGFGIENLQIGLVNLLQIMFSIFGVLSIFPIVIGGVQFIIAQTNGGDEGIQKAKKTIYWGILGLSIGFLGLVIIQFVLSIFLKS